MSRFSWQKLPRPFFALAPLAGISDSPFRQICKEQGADLVFTELISAEALSRCQKKTLDLIAFSQKERPIILQLFGKNPESFAAAARVIENLPAKQKPDGLDLNCGCPARKVKGHGSGIALMRDPDLVNKIIENITKNTALPLSIKIRAGIKKEKIQASEFVSGINWRKLAAITVHGRYFEQGFSGEIDFAEIKKIKKIVGSKIVIANGGIKDYKSGKIMLEKTKSDGLMIGQGSFGKPWVFGEIKQKLVKTPP
ncbi:MAG: tRNA-dihydrouridine synthase family protein, partial [bacterium]|nr:tRNA-dihydrouridine synthase family protein [bacterium]